MKKMRVVGIKPTFKKDVFRSGASALKFGVLVSIPRMGAVGYTVPRSLLRVPSEYNYCYINIILDLI